MQKRCPLALASLAAPLLALQVTIGAQSRWQTMPSPLLPDSLAGDGAAIAYDAQRGVVVLVTSDEGATPLVTKTWEWVGTRWRAGPALVPGRIGAAMAYDAVRKETVLFGGRKGSEASSETWVWNGASWTQRSPATSPPGRVDHAMCFHARAGVVLLCGGGGPGDPFATWTWNGSDWTQQRPQTSPPIGAVDAMAYDEARAMAVIVQPERGSFALSTWEWDGSNWNRRVSANVPGAREHHGLAYDTIRRRTILFGGVEPATGGDLDDTWEWDGTDWRRLVVSASPPARHGHTMAGDGARRTIVLLGGRAGSDRGFRDDAWQLIPIPVDDEDEAAGEGEVGVGGKFGGRKTGRNKLGGSGGGGKLAAEAIESGLQWLKEHQDEDGKWDADEFMKHDTAGAPCTGPGDRLHDVGVTGLALLAFLGDGSTIKSGPYKDVIKNGIMWLRQQQDDNTGLIGPPASHRFIYDHVIASLALCEAYGLSQYRSLKPIAQKAINYLEAHRNPFGCWRYQKGAGDNDMSVTGWAVLAYISAKEFGLLVDKKALDCADTYIAEMTDASGRTGYIQKGGISSRHAGQHAIDFPPDNGECMTAIGLLCNYFLGHDPNKDPLMARQAEVLAAKPPQWRKDPKGSWVDHYYWYYGTHAMYQVGGRPWAQWSRAIQDAVIPKQRADGNFKGSWDPDDAWGRDGGRVYSTAILVLTLEAYYRYARVHGGR